MPGHHTPIGDAALPSPARSRRTGRQRKFNRSVLSRLLIVAVAAVFVVHLASALVMATGTARSAERELESHLATILSSRSRLMAEPLWKMQYEKLTVMLNELVSDQTIVAGAVYDDSGAAVAAAGDASGARGETTRGAAGIIYRDGNIEAIAGRLEVAITRAPIAAAFWRSLMQALAVAFLATAAIMLGLFIATQRYIGRPLGLIAAAIERSRADGKRHKVRLDGEDEFGTLARAFNAMQDAAERGERALHAANRRLDFLALHDELTGLPNRRSFEEQLRQTASAMSASGTLAVHFIDLDDFKAINDTHGHAAGDKLLRHVGQQLRKAVRDCDFVARFGGDEFVVLQTGVGGEASARSFAEGLVAALGHPLLLASTAIRTGASVGVALMEGGANDIVRLLSLADIALYDAKRENRGRISFLTRAARDEHDRRRRMEADIRVALDQQQFTLHFQPQVRLDNGRPVGLEALVRWRHPVEGLMSPAEFLPLVDELGLTSELGAVVIDQACRSARQLREGGHELRIAVNLASAQLVDHGLVRQFEERMAEHRLSARALEVEITEVALIRDPHNATNILSGLRRLGITIALDDFGTGYSSLSYLRRFPIDRIKLDRSFVRELPEIKETAAIVRAVWELSRALGVEMIAEGIERQAEAAFLEGQGVEVAQGYLYCKPAPLPEVIAWLDRRKRTASQAA
jgi:c-di-GMP phosphodiesterase